MHQDHQTRQYDLGERARGSVPVRVKQGMVRGFALGVVMALPLVGYSGTAMAAKGGTAAKCAKHPNSRACRTGGKAGNTPELTIQVDPNLLPETFQSDVYAVIQVEANPEYAGDDVTVSSSQLNGSCEMVRYEAVGTKLMPGYLSVALDNNGNATVIAQGQDCAPGNDLIEADLAVAPYLTVVTVLHVYPPFVLVPGVYPNPTTSGTVTTGQVETGDSGTTASSVLNVFYVATDPVYAEQPVEIDSAQLDARCGTGWEWVPGDLGAPGTNVAKGAGPNTGPLATAIVDDDGNAVFVFGGESCAAGSSVVTADVVAGTHPTYVNTYTIVAPTPTV